MAPQRPAPSFQKHTCQGFHLQVRVAGVQPQSSEEMEERDNVQIVTVMKTITALFCGCC